MLVMFKCVCAKCGQNFEAPETEEYGEFVMRSEFAPEPALLEALVDPVYDEVDHILESIGAYQGKGRHEAAELLRAVFGVACDSAPDGSLLQIGRFAPCPACGSREMAARELALPPRAYEGPVITITHQNWTRLTRTEKERAIHGDFGLTAPTTKK